MERDFPLQKQLDTLAELLFIVDSEFRVLWANQKARQEWQCDPSQDKEVKCYELVKYCQPQKCPAKEVFKSKKPARGVMHIPGQGSFLISSSPILNQQGEVEAIWVLAIKLGAREAGKILGAYRYEIIGRLAVGFVHDIKNLVSYLMGELDILNLTTTEERLKRRYKKMQTILESIASLCQKLNALGDIAKEPELLNINLILKDLHPILCIFLPDKVNFEVHVDPGITPIKFNRAALEQIILNLILNAVEALPRKEGGYIKVWTKKERPWIRLIVEDNGMGIPEEYMDQIFDPFFSTKEGGSGLGLSLIKTWVEESGGRISVESEKGKGARFTVDFPIPEGFLETP